MSTDRGNQTTAGSDLSRLSERSRLELLAKVLEQKSQLEIEKKQRELNLEKNEETKWKRK